MTHNYTRKSQVLLHLSCLPFKPTQAPVSPAVSLAENPCVAEFVCKHRLHLPAPQDPRGEVESDLDLETWGLQKVVCSCIRPHPLNFGGGGGSQRDPHPHGGQSSQQPGNWECERSGGWLRREPGLHRPWASWRVTMATAVSVRLTFVPVSLSKSEVCRAARFHSQAAFP